MSPFGPPRTAESVAREIVDGPRDGSVTFEPADDGPEGVAASEVRTGADLVTYWKAAGLIGTRPDIADSQAEARAVRERAERRERE